MDTTPEYIRMCEKARRDLWGSLPIFSKRQRMLCVVDEKLGMWRDSVNTGNVERAIPVWEQDQLQEMLPMKPTTAEGMLTRMWDFWRMDVHKTVDSMEKLLLMQIMSGHGKVWNGEDWVIKT